MVKRKMPPHIVLPNGQWRFVKRGSKKARSRAGGIMVRHRKTHRKSGGFSAGGIMGYVKPVLIGTAGGLVAPRVPFLNTLPFYQAIAGGAACFLLGQKTIPKLAIGAASGQFVAPMANNAISSATGIRIY